MTSIFFYSFASVIIVSLISLVGVLAISVNESVLRKWILILVSIATGALFGDAIIHLIPEAFEESGNATVTSLLILGGILLFFILEKFLHWHHSHGHELNEEECLDGTVKNEAKQNIKPLGYLILVSDGFHNFLDGIIIAASYFVSIEVGIATTIAVILHEIPQEIGDFGVLLHSGFSKLKALVVNFISALFAILGVVFVLALGESGEAAVALIIPIAAGGFLYIAGSDLVPELHKTTNVGHSAIQLFAVLLGIAAMVALVALE